MKQIANCKMQNYSAGGIFSAPLAGDYLSLHFALLIGLGRRNR